MEIGIGLLFRERRAGGVTMLLPPRRSVDLVVLVSRLQWMLPRGSVRIEGGRTSFPFFASILCCVVVILWTVD